MHRGYIKLWRKSLDAYEYLNPKGLKLWIYLLLSATHKEIDHWDGHQKVKLLPGQIICGRNRLAKATGLKAGPLYYHLRELREAGLIGPRVRDLYVLTRQGRRLILATMATEHLCR